MERNNIQRQFHKMYFPLNFFKVRLSDFMKNYILKTLDQMLKEKL